MLYGLALLAGIVAGSRVFTGIAAVSWAARLGALNLERLLARVHGLCLDALDLHSAGDRRIGH